MGKKSSTGRRLLFLLIGALLSIAGAQESTRICDEQVQSASRKTIVIARSEGADVLGSQESSWIPPFVEAFLYFRLGAVQQLIVVPSDTIASQLSSAGSDATAIPGEQGMSKYLSVAKSIKASYLLFTQFKPANSRKSVIFSLSLIGTGNDAADTFSVSSPVGNPVENIEAALDSCVNKMLLGSTVSLLPREKKLLGINLVGPGKNTKIIGSALANSKTLKGKEHENIAQDLKKLVGQDPKAYLAYYAGALEFARAARFEDAALLLRDLILKIGPNYPALYPLAARNYRLSDNNEDALQIVNMAQGMKLTTDALLLEKALVFEALEDLEKAGNAYQEVLACDSTNYDALLFMTKKYNKENRSFEALAMAKLITSNYPNQGIGYLELGKCLIGLKQTAEAKNALQMAADLMPNDGVPLLLLGDFCSNERDYDRALGFYQKAMPLMPQSADIYVKTAQTHMALGNYIDALELLRKVEKQFYDNPVFLKALGTAEYRLSDTVKAQRDFNRFCENGGRDAEVFTLLGDIHRNKGQMQKALEFYEKAQLLEPSNNDIREKVMSVKVKADLSEKAPGDKGNGSGDDGNAPSKGHGRIVFQIGSGVACLGAIAAGVFMDREVARQYTTYQGSRVVVETQSLRTSIEKNTLYRNILYAAGGVLGLGCSITFFIPSKNQGGAP